jgi:hypothetical protein
MMLLFQLDDRLIFFFLFADASLASTMALRLTTLVLALRILALISFTVYFVFLTVSYLNHA